MLIDTHCHIYLDQFDDDIHDVLDRAADSGVSHIFMPAISFDSLPKMDAMKHDEIRFHKVAGIHPTEFNNGLEVSEQELVEHCSGKDIVAVGETGLDYYWSDEFKDQQKQSLHMHCRVAKSLGKPVILHNRESTDDLLGIIEEEQNGSLTGIWHCFNGTVEEGRRAVDLGLHLGIGGVLTFKNSGVDETVSQLPFDKMVLETDAPYLSPSPHRGKRNEPSYIEYTARRLAAVVGMQQNEIEKRTSETALSLFNV